MQSWERLEVTGGWPDDSFQLWCELSCCFTFCLLLFWCKMPISDSTMMFQETSVNYNIYSHACFWEAVLTLISAELAHHLSSTALQKPLKGNLMVSTAKSVSLSFLTEWLLDVHVGVSVLYSTCTCRVTMNCCTWRTHCLEEQLGRPRRGVGGTAVGVKIIIIKKKYTVF